MYLQGGNEEVPTSFELEARADEEVAGSLSPWVFKFRSSFFSLISRSILTHTSPPGISLGSVETIGPSYWTQGTTVGSLCLVGKVEYVESFIVFVCAVAITSTLSLTPYIFGTPASSHNIWIRHENRKFIASPKDLSWISCWRMAAKSIPYSTIILAIREAPSQVNTLSEAVEKSWKLMINHQNLAANVNEDFFITPCPSIHGVSSPKGEI